MSTNRKNETKPVVTAPVADPVVNVMTVTLPGVMKVPNTKLGGVFHTARVHDMSLETIVNVFAHGLKQITNDSHSSLNGSDAGNREAIIKAGDTMIERLNGNQWSPRSGGGPRLTPFEIELRNVAEAQLRKVCGRNGAEAKVTKVADALKSVALTLVARKRGINTEEAMAGITEADTAKVVEALATQWAATARRNLEAVDGLSIDLDALGV